LRRSGRVKCNGPVIEENTVDDAYFVEDDSSGDDFVKTTYVKGKGIELGDDNENDKNVKREKGKSFSSGTTKRLKRKTKKPYVFQTRTSPKALYNAIVTLKPSSKGCLARIGFADVLEFKCDGIPSKMGFYVVDNFSQHNMEIKLNKRSIEITQELIGEMLGIRNKGVDIMEEEDANDEEMAQN
nr:major facilitator superfamily domain, general substrate transporter [Tanacetum cinerariifolium]